MGKRFNDPPIPCGVARRHRITDITHPWYGWKLGSTPSDGSYYRSLMCPIGGTLRV